MEALKKERGTVRSRVTRLFNKHNDNISGLNDSERVVLTNKLLELRTELKKSDEIIQLHPSFDESHLDDFLEEVEDYEDRIGLLLVQLGQTNDLNTATSISI